MKRVSAISALVSPLAISSTTSRSRCARLPYLPSGPGRRTGGCLAAAILVVAAVASYINARYLKWPPTVGLLVISLVGSLIVILLGELEIISLTDAERIVKTINFEEVVLNGMLAFLLFAGALHVDLERLRRQKVPITIMATAGVAGATFITGTLFWLAADLADSADLEPAGVHA